MSSTVQLDIKTLPPPTGILHIHHALSGLLPGVLLEVHARDPQANRYMPMIAGATRHKLLTPIPCTDGIFVFECTRRGAASDDPLSHVERGYARLLESIVLTWGTPAGTDFLKKLVFDDRGDRAGFPPEVLSELALLEEIHTSLVPELKGRATAAWNTDIPSWGEGHH